MGVAEKHIVMDEAANWPAELHFRKCNNRKVKRSRSPTRAVSPAPSYYSEPLSVRQRKDVTVRLPSLTRAADQEDEDDEDTQSLKSLPTVMNTLAFDKEVKRSHRLHKGHVISDLSLPLLLTSKCTLMVKGTGCTRSRGFLPAIKPKAHWESTSQERPPCRAGCRPHKVGHSPLNPSHHSEKTWIIRESFQHLPSSSLSLGPRITFQSPVVQPVYPVTTDKMKDTRLSVQSHQPLKPVLKKPQALNKGALQCLLEESFLPCPSDPHLLEQFSGFQEHLCHQLLNSPLPQVNSYHLLHLGAMLPVSQGAHRSLNEHTVELCNSPGKRLPSITMTCPTPSPNHLHHPENRHVA
ncbi:uncharacterized protein si:dkey-39a18.1 [Trichomycterus rosablanca]|uniref:uncharacterized protein si:dkey-39a18.1 n=1 Tax=Trichomycterus rosablanca TaxID=2290929 RepID=UPI002F3514AB